MRLCGGHWACVCAMWSVSIRLCDARPCAPHRQHMMPLFMSRSWREDGGVEKIEDSACVVAHVGTAMVSQN
eukprot:408956-Rhodomonas_salina.2